MEKIRFIADTASDIPDEDLREYGIDLPSVPIAVDGKEYLERKSFGFREFYRVLAASKEIPVTSRVPADDFLACYINAYGEDCTDVVCVTINAKGSGTNASAVMAKELFYKRNPEASGKMNIHVVDSRTYAAAYGYPVIQSAKKARDGATVADILAYLDDWFSRVEIILGCYTLEYARKSGRINAAAAFVGDVLGVRPLISMIDGDTKTIDKVRGEKKLAERISAIALANASDRDQVLIVGAAEEQHTRELRELLKKELGYAPPVYLAGASIAINAGPRMIAAVYLGEKRPTPLTVV